MPDANVVPFPFGMPINSGKPWSEMDDNDLIHFNELGEPIEITAEFLCRTVEECEARLLELKPKDRLIARWLASKRSVDKEKADRDETADRPKLKRLGAPSAPSACSVLNSSPLALFSHRRGA